MQWPSDLWLQLAAVPGSEMLLLFLMNKQHSADLKLIKHMVTKSKENLKPVLTVHVQKCCLGFWSSRSVLRSTPALVTGVWSWTAGSVFPTSSSGGQCMGLFCGLVHSAFCMLFCVRSWQGAEEYTGTQGPGPSEKPGFWKHYFPALAWSVLHHSLDNLPIRIILCAPLSCHWAPMWTPMARQEEPSGSTRELSISKVGP